MSTAGTPMLLSAVLPNYNHGAVIGEAIAALAAQLPAPDEIIVIDDASTDNSREVLVELAQRFPLLRIVALDRNGGAIAALNRGLEEARGTFVYFGAADDLTLPGLFANLLPLVEQAPGIAFASAEGLVLDIETGEQRPRPPVRPSGKPVILSPAEVADTFQRIDNWILTGAAIIRAASLRAIGGFDRDLRAFADGYALRALALRYGCGYAPHCGLVWRVSSLGLSRSQAADADASLAVLDAALSRMRADAAFPDWYPRLFERRWRFAIGRLAAQSVPINRTALERIMPSSSVDRLAMTIFAKLGQRIGRVAALGWMTIRLRPTSLAGLLWTAFQRRFTGTRTRAGASRPKE